MRTAVRKTLGNERLPCPARTPDADDYPAQPAGGSRALSPSKPYASLRDNVFGARRWDPIRFLFYCGWLATLGASASWAAEIPAIRAEQPPDFTADFALSLDGEGRPAMGVSIAIPYQGLQWVRLPQTSDRYGVDLEISVVFEPRKSGPLHGTVWQRQVVVEGFEATRVPRAAIVERKTLDLPPGKYRVGVHVRDLNAGLESQADEPVEVPDYSRVPVGFADLELGVVDSVGAFRPLPTRVFGAEARSLAARAALFDRRPGSWPRVYNLRHRILDESGAVRVEGRKEFPVSRSAEPIVIRPEAGDLFLGRYVMEVELVDGRSRWRVERSFEVEESGPPRGAEFDKWLEPVSYIATSEEVQRMRNLGPEEQARAWEEFWRRRDPSPDTPRNEALIEFIRRVRYAERHFQGYGPGWRSDMGRIYIRYGPPAQVESRPASTGSPPVEIWSYENPFRRFVFADREGFGRYVLVSPLGE
jgi:GWxTD domain-containing protein